MNGSDRSRKSTKITTGIDGFDGILDGGYASNRVHLIEGQPRTGIEVPSRKVSQH
jgi:circadian clock protein KaiC